MLSYLDRVSNGMNPWIELGPACELVRHGAICSTLGSELYFECDTRAPSEHAQLLPSLYFRRQSIGQMLDLASCPFNVFCRLGTARMIAIY